MSYTQEREKQRRQYLKKKRAAYTKAGLAVLLAAPSAIAAFFLLIGAVLVIIWPPNFNDDFGRPIPPNDYYDFHSAIAIFLILALLSLCFGSTSWLLARLARRAHKEAKQLPYVPPITADTLPAEEVLVRGSEEPAQEQSKVLLRGTDGGTVTGEQELLRGSQGQDRE